MIDKYTKYEYYLVMGYNPNEIEKIIQNLTVPSD